MRHADAVDGEGNDFSRTLSEKGNRQARKMGEWLAANHEGDILVVSSPLPRARQTADAVAEAFGKHATLQQDERLAPGMTTDTASEVILEFGKKAPALMLVGHAPDLGELASYLIGGKEGAVEMRKAAIVCFETVRAGLGGSALRWLINPKCLGVRGETSRSNRK